MNFRHFLTDWPDGKPDTGLPDPSIEMSINPANGLPMIEGTGLDIKGNPFGTDNHAFDADSTGIELDDCNNLSNLD